MLQVFHHCFYRWDACGSERLGNLLRAAQLGMKRSLGSWAFWPFWPLEAVTKISLMLHFQLVLVLGVQSSGRQGSGRPSPRSSPQGWAGHSCSGLICIKVSWSLVWGRGFTIFRKSEGNIVNPVSLQNWPDVIVYWGGWFFLRSGHFSPSRLAWVVFVWMLNSRPHSGSS